MASAVPTTRPTPSSRSTFAVTGEYANPLPLDGSPGLRFFDSRITSGPVLNLPAAALMAVVGNTPWVPGVATATLVFGVMLVTYAGLVALAGATRAAAYSVLVLLFLYVETAGVHFEHWHALLGEGPATALCLAGAVLAARAVNNRRAVWPAALVFGLALATKMLALLSALPLALWLVWRVAVAPGDARRASAVDALGAGAALAAPLAAYHAWQVHVLGWNTYVEQTREFLRFVQSHDAVTALPTSVSGAWPRLLTTSAANAASFHAHFGYPLVLLAALAIGAGIALHRRSVAPEAGALYALLMGAAAVHLTWWACLSNGQHRYALIGLFLYSAAICCVVFVRGPWLTAALVAPLAITLMVQLAGPLAIQPARFAWNRRGRYTPRVVNMVKTAAFLDTLAPQRPFVMGWWATASDLEYAMATSGNFIGSMHLDPNAPGPSRILVRNTTWVAWATTPEFAAWEQRCAEVLLAAPPYLVSRCPSVP